MTYAEKLAEAIRTKRAVFKTTCFECRGNGWGGACPSCSGTGESLFWHPAIEHAVAEAKAFSHKAGETATNTVQLMIANDETVGLAEMLAALEGEGNEYSQYENELESIIRSLLRGTAFISGDAGDKRCNVCGAQLQTLANTDDGTQINHHPHKGDCALVKARKIAKAPLG